MSATFPPPNATRKEVDVWVKEHGATEPPLYLSVGNVPHEAPPVENGPSLVCNACGVVRVSMNKPFCNGCMNAMAAAGAPIEGVGH